MGKEHAMRRDSASYGFIGNDDFLRENCGGRGSFSPPIQIRWPSQMAATNRVCGPPLVKLRVENAEIIRRDSGPMLYSAMYS